MKYTISLLFLVVTATLSCAKPNYTDADVISNSTSCAFHLKQLNLCADIQWLNSPVVSAYTSFQSRFYLPSLPGQNINPSGAVHFYLWMPSMGHGSSPISTTETGLGDFLSTDVFFIMPGEWEIRLHILNPQGQVIDEARYPLSL